MDRRLLLALLLASCAANAADQATAGARTLVGIPIPSHDPLYIDMSTIDRRGNVVSFKYVLDVRAPPEENQQLGPWRSNEIDAWIDCAKRLVGVRRLTAFPGPRASGNATAVHSFSGADVKPQKIELNSTFAHLEQFVCRTGK
jgi:hypothetical protein